MSATDLRKSKSINSLSGEISFSMKMMKMKSESNISSLIQNSDTVKSLSSRTKSVSSIDLRSSDSNSCHSKKLPDSDSLSLKLSSSFDSDEVMKNVKIGDNCNTLNGSQTDTQIFHTVTLDPDEGGGLHQKSPTTSDTVLLDLNENEAKSTPQFQSILGTPTKTFVLETQNTEKSPEEFQISPDPPAKRRKKRVSHEVPIEEKGECPLCGRLMKTKVLQEHAVYCNGSDRRSLRRKN